MSSRARKPSPIEASTYSVLKSKLYPGVSTVNIIVKPPSEEQEDSANIGPYSNRCFIPTTHNG